MQLVEAASLARSLMKEFGVYGEDPYFLFKWANGKRTLGSCHYILDSTSGRYISLSKTYVQLNDVDLVEGTIRHEIAHALDVLDRGYSDHSFAWKLKCRITGANPERLNSGDIKRAKAKYETVCQCGKKFSRHRISKSTTYRCPTCKDKLFVSKTGIPMDNTGRPMVKKRRPATGSAGKGIFFNITDFV